MSNIKPLTILLAEDNEDHAELMIEALEEFNVANNIIHVENGEKVLCLLRREPPYDSPNQLLPELVLLDQKMPLLDGIGVLKAIKSDPALKHIPVVMISTSTVDSEIAHCFELGASGYITKPLNFEEFSRKMRDLNMYWVLTSEIPKRNPL